MQDQSPIRIENTSVPVVVLVSSQHGGVGIIRSLGREGIPVYGVHQDSWEPAAFSRFLRRVFRWDFSSAPEADSLSFLRDVARQIGRQPLLVPTSDTTALFVAENAAVLEREYLFSTPSAEVVRCFVSKLQTFDLCRKLRIPTAETASPQSREEVVNFAQTVGFPLVVKGEYGEFLGRTGTRLRVEMVAGENELLDVFHLNAATGRPGIILQEYIPGGDDAIWMFNGYFNDQSRCLFGATGRKLRQFPPHRGSTSLGMCATNDAVEIQTKRLMRAVGYRGPLDVGYRFDARDGQYKLLDANPRIGSTFRLFRAKNGLDVARALYLDLTGQSIPSAPVLEGRKWIVETNDLASSWSQLRKRQLTLGAWMRSLRGVQEGVWLVSDDLAPLALLPLLWLRKRFGGRAGPASTNSSSTDSALTETQNP
jgi:predicted ATP-grasp superfamily ATP-dependent carboligase